LELPPLNYGGIIHKFFGKSKLILQFFRMKPRNPAGNIRLSRPQNPVKLKFHLFSAAFFGQIDPQNPLNIPFTA